MLLALVGSQVIRADDRYAIYVLTRIKGFPEEFLPVVVEGTAYTPDERLR